MAIIRWINKRRIEKALKFISPDVKFILDDGCGDGHFIARLQGKKVVGLDLSIIRLKRARKLAPEASLVRGDSQNLPFKENTFDCVICCDVLEHLPNPNRAVLDLLRVLRPQCHTIVSIPNEMVWRIGRLLMLRFPLSGKRTLSASMISTFPSEIFIITPMNRENVINCMCVLQIY